MPSLNVDLDYFGHPKTVRLVGALGRGADLLPLRLWAYCGKFHHKDGMLVGYEVAGIENIIGWWGELGAAVAGMVRVGFLEVIEGGWKCHDWEEHEGHLEVFRVRSAAAAKARWGESSSKNPSSITKGQSLKQSPYSAVQGSACNAGQDEDEVKPGPAAPEFKPATERALKVLDALAKCTKVRITDLRVISSWEIAFPDVDLAAEILKADSWCVANKATKTQWARFLHNWFSRTQDRVRPAGEKPRAHFGAKQNPSAQGDKYAHVESI